jgi:hypothetical protein
MEMTMRKVILAIVIAASAITGAVTSAFAQGVYFGFGGDGYRRHYDNDYGYRPYYRQPAYAYGERCYVRTVRHFNRYRGVWVVRRIRTCD